MNQLINQFRDNIQQIKNIHEVYQFLNKQTTNLLNFDDVLRSEVVLILSALDFYIHELVRKGMLEIYQGNRMETKSFKNFNISMSTLKNINNNQESINLIDSEIRLRNGFKSFQQSDKIAEAVRLISEIKLWKEVGQQLGLDSSDVKNQLNLIVDRRNKIAHEADMNPAYPNIKWDIDETLVKEIIDFISKIVETIHNVVNVT